MTAAALVVVLALGWVAVTGGFTMANLLLGGLVAIVAVLLMRHQLARPIALSRATRILLLAVFFLKELLLSALGVAALVLSPRLDQRLKPAIIAFPLTATSDAEITLLANLITLTPGTLSVDISDDHRQLYVHVLSLRDREALTHALATGFEKKVIDVFR